MVVGRDKRIPASVRPKLPKFNKSKALLLAGLVAIVGTALLTPVHSFTAKTGAIVIPPPPPLIINGKAVLSGSASGSVVQAGPAAKASLPKAAFPQGQAHRRSHFSAHRQPAPHRRRPVRRLGPAERDGFPGGFLESDVDVLPRGFLAGGGRHGVHRSQRRLGTGDDGHVWQLRGRYQPRCLLVRRNRGLHLLSAASRQAGHHRRLDLVLADRSGDLAGGRRARTPSRPSRLPASTPWPGTGGRPGRRCRCQPMASRQTARCPSTDPT